MSDTDQQQVQHPDTPDTAAAPVADDAGEEVEAEAAAGDGPSNNKKKKKKKKKKKTAAKKNREEFARWCQQALTATKSQVEGISDDVLRACPPEFNGYEPHFTGSLRPQHVTAQLRMPDTIAAPDYHETGIPTSEIENKRDRTVTCYTKEEIDQLREVCQIGRQVLDIAGQFLKEGVTGDEIDRIVYQACLDRECYPSPLNYNHFPKSVCVSPNEVICHGIPDCRPVQNGDIINLDISVYKNGFHADLNETFLIGETDQKSKDLVEVAYNCLYEASKLIRPGCMYRDLGAVISKVAHTKGFSVVKSYCGHGIGRLFHTSPNVPHYSKNKAIGIMKPGHVFTIEPMINASGNWKDGLWPDNWTAVTKDGARSAQFEHTFVVTETGVEILTARPGTSITEMPAYDAATVTR